MKLSNTTALVPEAEVDPKLSRLITSFLKSNCLTAMQLRGTNQPKFEIFPESGKDYFLKVVDAQITFVTDAQGRATELILHQGGVDQHAERVE